MTNILGKSKEKEQAYINDYATLVVPQNKRRSSFSLTMVLIGSIICLSSIYTGASFSGGLTVKEVIIACLIGNLTLSVLGGVLSYIGTKTGVGDSNVDEKRVRNTWELHNCCINSYSRVGVVWMAMWILRANHTCNVSECGNYNRTANCRSLGRSSDDDHSVFRI